ncbi:MAG: PH domain-containing protein [Verrucomicrobiaceae bacterium]|nr:PH domain-containing protein [Verrucomicrobiaceae bacterium]
MQARYLLQHHPTFSEPLSREDIHLLVASGSLARGEMCFDSETGHTHTVGELINGMRSPRTSATEARIARPAYREITPDFEGPPDELVEEADDENEEPEEDEDDGNTYTPSGELILHHSHPSWLAYMKALSLTVLLAIAAGLLFVFHEVFALVALSAALFVLFCVFVARSTRDYIVTPQRVELLWGILGRSSKEARICDIRSIDVYEHGIKGLLGLGTLDFSTAANAGIEVQFLDMRRAHEVKELVRQLQSGTLPTED